jgi:hypothetical protein
LPDLAKTKAGLAKLKATSSNAERAWLPKLGDVQIFTAKYRQQELPLRTDSNMRKQLQRDITNHRKQVLNCLNQEFIHLRGRSLDLQTRYPDLLGADGTADYH